MVAFTENYEVSISAFVTAEGNSCLTAWETLRGRLLQRRRALPRGLSELPGRGDGKTLQKNDDCLGGNSGQADAAFMDAPAKTWARRNSRAK